MKFLGKIFDYLNEYIYNENDHFKASLNCIENIVFKDFACGPSMIALLDINENIYLYNDSRKLVLIKNFKNVKQFFFSLNDLICICDNNIMYILTNKDGNLFNIDYVTFNCYKINEKVKFQNFELPFYQNLIFLESSKKNYNKRNRCKSIESYNK